MIIRALRHLLLISLGVLVAGCGSQPQAPGAGEVSSETLSARPDGVIATRSSWASDVGAQVLAQGGNAVDAAVAAGFALAVSYPSAGNIGGGGFMVIRLADGTVTSNDHREKAPLKASRDMYLDAQGEIVKGRSTRTHLAVGVPGTVAGLLDVLARYGTMTRQQVLAPAIELAAQGIILDEDLATSFARRLKDFEPHAASMAIFSKSGAPYAAGDRFRQPDLAAALQRISDAGKDGFYKGRTAQLLVEEMEANGGLISHEDLQAYTSVWREPIRGDYRGHEILSMPPPSSGGVLLVQMLNMLETLDLSAAGFGTSATMHAMIEAERRAYADRAQYLGDPDFYPVPVQRLTSKAYAIERFADFDATRASKSEDIGAGVIPIEESPDTTHLSVIDGWGNAVAYTTTLNLSYGSRIVAAGTGILLNNEMDDFSAKENAPNFYGLLGRAANAIAPGKRMLSSMTPTIVVRDDKPLLVTGSPGGSTIITTTMQVILNVLDHEMDVAQAVASPRFHHQWMPDRVMHEAAALDEDTAQALREMGHTNLAPIPAFLGRGIGDANSVMWTEQGIVGAADPRNAGTAESAARAR